MLTKTKRTPVNRSANSVRYHKLTLDSDIWNNSHTQTACAQAHDLVHASLQRGPRSLASRVLFSMMSDSSDEARRLEADHAPCRHTYEKTVTNTIHRRHNIEASTEASTCGSDLFTFKAPKVHIPRFTASRLRDLNASLALKMVESTSTFRCHRTLCLVREVQDGTL